VRLVNFKSLTNKNFLSVGETPVTINFQTGDNVITGINYDKKDSKNSLMLLKKQNLINFYETKYKKSSNGNQRGL
jgi:hypothetical protein